MKIYHVSDWEKYYEVSDSRKVDGPLNWVSVRTKTDGFGFRRIASQPNRCELLAAWYLILGIAAKLPRGERGKLVRDGQPLTAEDMAIITGFPAQVFEDALVFFSEPKQKWLSVVECPDEAGSRPEQSGPNPSTGQDRTGQDSSLSKPAETESEWLDRLTRAWKGIDIPAQIKAASAHRRKAGAKLERAWFESVWLPKSSPEVKAANAQTDTIPEPYGWLEFARSEFPDAIFFSDGPTPKWAALEQSHRQLIADRMKTQKPER